MTTAAAVIAGAGVFVAAVPIALVVGPAALRRRARPHATAILLSWTLALIVMIGAGWVEAGNIRDRCRDDGGVWVGRIDQGDCIDREAVVP